MLRKAVFFSTFLCIIIIGGCLGQFVQDSKITPNFQFGIIYTSNSSSSSEVLLFSKKWKLQQKIAFDVSGLGTQTPTIESDNFLVYLPATGRRIAGKEVEILDLKQRKIGRLDTDLFPMIVKVNETGNYLYVLHNESPKGLVTKIDIKKNKVIKRLKLDKWALNLVVNNDKVYIISDQFSLTDKPEDDGFQTIDIFDTNLNLIQSVQHMKGSYPLDAIIKKNKLIIANNLLGISKNTYSKNITEMNTDSYKVTERNIGYPPKQLFDLGSETLVLAQDFPQSTVNKFIVIDDITRSLKEYDSKNYINRALVSRNKLFVLGNPLNKGKGPPKAIFEYNLKDFSLLKIHQLPDNGEHVISNMFLHPNSF